MTELPLVVSRSSLTARAAQALIDAAEAHAAGLGLGIVTVVVDESGVTKALRRMDGAPLGALVGAIGISGGHYSHDEACARAALAAVGFHV